MLQFPFFEWRTIELGALTIQVWGLFVALGIGFSLFLLKKRSHLYRTDAVLLLDLAFWILIGGFLGARFAHIFLYEPTFYLSHPAEMLKVWHGGLSSFGGIIGAVISFFLFIKKRALLPKQVMQIAEQLSYAALFGWMVGRVGCSMIHDHWGIPCNCPFAIQTSSGPRLDMAVIEILLLLPLAIFFFLKRKMVTAQLYFFPLLLIYYGILRFLLDFLRATDITGADSRYLGLTPAQYFAILMTMIGVYLIKKRGEFA